MALNLNYTPNKLVDITTLTEDQWLDWRRKGIGGSDVAVALNSSPYRTARELYYDKIGVVMADEGPDNDTHLQYGDDFQMLEVQNSEEAARLVIKNYLREVAIHGIENVQILSPFRKRGAVASNALNETIRELVNPPNNLKKEMKCGSRVFRVGDRIMQTVNRINVSNGDVGIITDVETEDDDTIARVKLLDGRELSYTQEMLEDLEFSYCTTIHKSQGQEYPVIIVPLLKEHYIMLRRNLLYTAVTRAKAKVILIGQKQAVFIAIHKCDVGQRNTVLADRIVAYYNRELCKRVT